MKRVEDREHPWLYLMTVGACLVIWFYAANRWLLGFSSVHAVLQALGVVIAGLGWTGVKLHRKLRNKKES